MVVPFRPFPIRIELTLNETENSLKCKALLMNITKTASFFFSFSVPDVIDSSTFGFKTRCRSYFPLKTGANCKTGALKRTKKKIDFCVLSLVFRKKMSALA